MLTSNQITELRQLCCLGLGEQKLMPPLFDLIQKLIPADLRLFIWADEKYKVANLYSPELPQMADVASLYVTEFANTRRERAVKPSFSQIMKTKRGVINWVQYENKNYFRSDFYNLLLKPAGVRHLIGAIIHDRKRTLGELTLTRSPSRKKFSPSEEKTLASLIPYIEHGLTQGHGADLAYGESARKGLIVLNHKGEIQHLCTQARELLFWAGDPRFSQNGPKWRPSVSVPEELLALCRNLLHTYRGADAPAPVWSCRNGWGLFTFRAYVLEEESREKTGLLGITVEMHDPQAVQLLSQLQKFPLTPRQKEVCLMLLSGYHNNEISQKLQMSRHTLIHHIRGIYEKMGLHSQAELFATFRVFGAGRKRMDASARIQGLSRPALKASH